MKKNNKENEKFDDQVEGRNSVIELLESGRDINKIYISNGEKHGSINKIIELAKKRKVVISQVDRNKINQMSQTDNNQGVIAIVPPLIIVMLRIFYKMLKIKTKIHLLLY